MLELTADNAVDFLRAHAWVAPGPVTVTELSGGVSNIVLRVETPTGRFVLKQSRPQLRTRAVWHSDLDRVYREQEVMELLGPLLPPLTVPVVLHVDRANYVFAMSHAPDSATVWKAALLAGEIDLHLGELAGVVLGRMHQATSVPGVVDHFRDRTVFEQLRTEPFYLRVQERHPEVTHAIEPIIERLRGEGAALCHGDYTPKNMLVHADGFMLVDYETAYLGDPTMDAGLFLTHVLLKAVYRPEQRDEFCELTRAFWRGYGREVSFRPLDELVIHSIQHLGVCLLARVDGTSPVEYLPDEGRRDAVRCLGRRLLLDEPHRWDDVLSLFEIV